MLRRRRSKRLLQYWLLSNLLEHLLRSMPSVPPPSTSCANTQYVVSCLVDEFVLTRFLRRLAFHISLYCAIGKVLNKLRHIFTLCSCSKNVYFISRPCKWNKATRLRPLGSRDCLQSVLILIVDSRSNVLTRLHVWIFEIVFEIWIFDRSNSDCCFDAAPGPSSKKPFSVC
jgi:hypothetical protein